MRNNREKELNLYLKQTQILNTRVIRNEIKFWEKKYELRLFNSDQISFLNQFNNSVLNCLNLL